MLKLLTKIFLSSGAVLGTFAATGNLPLKKKEIGILVSEEPRRINTSGDIKTIKDIEIFEKNNNCSFSFSHRWDQQEVYGIEEFLKRNKEHEGSKKYIEKAIRKANEFREDCKKNEVIVLFYYGDDFTLAGTVSSRE